MINEKQKNILKKISIVSVFVIATVLIGLLMLKYEVEGETNMPFTLSKITVISSAEGISDLENKLNLSLVQNNDIYIQIDKNANIKKEYKIKTIKIENIKVNQSPNIGTICFYSPSLQAREIFDNNETSIIERIDYIAKEKSDIKRLEIGNQGGIIGLRYSIKDLGECTILEQINHDGTILNELGINIEDLKSNISFDIVIELERGIKFKGNAEFDFPTGNILEEGISKIEKTDLKYIIFKRI